MAMTTEVFIEEYEHFYRMGYSTPRIADFFGIENRYAHDKAKRLGLPIRNPEETFTVAAVEKMLNNRGIVYLPHLPEYANQRIANDYLKRLVKQGVLEEKPARSEFTGRKLTRKMYVKKENDK